MSPLRDALTQYVALRRALGTQLQEPAKTLCHFVEFLEREGAEFITSELALRWAMEPKLVQRHMGAAAWYGQAIRRMAQYRRCPNSGAATTAPRCPARRNKPHIFCRTRDRPADGGG